MLSFPRPPPEVATTQSTWRTVVNDWTKRRVCCPAWLQLRTATRVAWWSTGGAVATAACVLSLALLIGSQNDFLVVGGCATPPLPPLRVFMFVCVYVCPRPCRPQLYRWREEYHKPARHTMAQLRFEIMKHRRGPEKNSLRAKLDRFSQVIKGGGGADTVPLVHVRTYTCAVLVLTATRGRNLMTRPVVVQPTARLFCLPKRPTVGRRLLVGLLVEWDGVEEGYRHGRDRPGLCTDLPLRRLVSRVVVLCCIVS